MPTTRPQRGQDDLTVQVAELTRKIEDLQKELTEVRARRQNAVKEKAAAEAQVAELKSEIEKHKKEEREKKKPKSNVGHSQRAERSKRIAKSILVNELADIPTLLVNALKRTCSWMTDTH